MALSRQADWTARGSGEGKQTAVSWLTYPSEHVTLLSCVSYWSGGGEGRAGQGKNNKSSRRRGRGERKGERGGRPTTPSQSEGARAKRKRRLETSTVTPQFRSGGGGVAGFFFKGRPNVWQNM